IYMRPRHPYAAALVDAVPRVDEASAGVGLPGLPPPSVVTGRCSFAERCRFAQERCRAEAPRLVAVEPPGAAGRGPAVHDVRCLRTAELGPIPTGRVPPPDLAADPERAAEQPLLRIQDLRCAYPGGRGRPTMVAVGGVSLDLRRGETLAVV